MKTRLRMVDTTLRDGEQRAGIAFRTEKKLRCALALDEAGIDQIEAGIPSMGKEEQELIRAILRRRKHARVSVWNRLRREDILQSLALEPDIIHITAPASDLQIAQKLHKTRAFVLEQLPACIALARSGAAEVTLGLEDASRADRDFLVRLAAAAKEQGVARLRYADTVGVAFPSKTAEDIRLLRETGMDVEFHAHDDLGMAVANSLEAAKSGAAFIDTTFCGIGERAGNCDFRSFLRAASPRFAFGFPCGNAETAELEARIRAILGI